MSDQNPIANSALLAVLRTHAGRNDAAEVTGYDDFGNVVRITFVTDEAVQDMFDYPASLHHLRQLVALQG